MAGLDLGSFKMLESGLGLDSVPSFDMPNIGDFKLAESGLNLGGYSGLLNTIDNTVGFNSGGFLNDISRYAKDIGGYATGALDALTKYRQPLQVAGNIGLGIANYQTNQDRNEMMRDYYNSLMAEQKRQVAKEGKAQTAFEEGFKSSNYYNV